MIYLEFSTTKHTNRRAFLRSALCTQADQIGKYRYRALCESDAEVKACKRECKRYACRVVSIYTEREKRGTNYRTAFFKANPMPEGGYRCRYCGRRLTKSKVQVDHVYPVDLAKKKGIPKYLANKGVEDINDLYNLVPACQPCNRRKGNHAGVWILLAWLGKHPAWHIIRRIGYAALALLALWLLVRPPKAPNF